MTPARQTRRTKKVETLNLSEHTLDINTRKCNYEKFRFADIEDYVRAMSAGREYQYEAIKQTMTYLWGGSYDTITDLARENFKAKDHIRQRFGSEELMIGQIPLADRLSGVVHMATGSGKTWVMFAVAYLSIVMGLTRRVLVLGPSSTIIEEGLREKFREFLDKKEWNDLLPREYQGKAVSIANDNDAIEDDTIVIENINAVFTFGGIQDTFFHGVDEVLVLSDEVHHAYSHLKFNATKTKLEMDADVSDNAQKSEARDERLWMQFLLGIGRYDDDRYHRDDGRHKITRHIGFTGTPYNSDDFFADVIYDYNVRMAIDEKYIKDINPIIRTETDEGAIQFTTYKKFEVVLKNHLDNAEKYSYIREEKRQVKPITVFYCPTIANAKKRTEEFVQFLAEWEQNQGNASTKTELEHIARERVICVTGGNSESEFKAKLDNIEEIDPNKIGGAVEFIFSVSKLLEGWDVDNVFQIVPMEEKVFNSKLLISQVIGRGLRIPRKVTHADIQANYPLLTVTNHESFANHVQELVHAVTHSDMFIVSEPLLVDTGKRGALHFSVFNLNYITASKNEVVEEDKQKEMQMRTLSLTKYSTTEDATIYFEKGTKHYALHKKKVSVDSIVDALHRRFRSREQEGLKFDFGDGVQTRCPSENEIRKKILSAMTVAGIESDGLVEENKKQIDLYFNQFLPPGKKKRVFINITGDVECVSTITLSRGSVRVGELERDAAAFLSEEYNEEVDEKTKAVLRYINEERSESDQQQISFSDPMNLLGKHGEYVRPLVTNDPRPPYIVNPSVFKTPQSTILVTHHPEREFTFRLLEHSQYITSWIKSPDKGFYSIDYEYWKKGKDRVRRGFNPDFFIQIDLDQYIDKLVKQDKKQYLDSLRSLQDKGIEKLIHVVEIKSDDDDDEATPKKAEYATEHFKKLNEKLIEVNPVDIPKEHHPYLKQHYIFKLLTPTDYFGWFSDIRTGKI